ncbi:MAG: MgtC/SapB family protein [Fimbriimonadales bacterium]
MMEADALLRALEVLIKAGIAVICAGLIGWEREIHGRPAGVRTHMLMALGVLLFSEVSKAFSSTDETRIAANIVTGVGFLGAGTILRTGLEVKGLTTAASIWSVTGIVMAVSVGRAFYWVALAGTALTLITLALVSGIERKLAPNAHGAVLLVRTLNRSDTTAILDALVAAGAKVVSVGTETDEAGAVLRIGITGEQNRAMKAVLELGSTRSAEWADT